MFVGSWLLVMYKLSCHLKSQDDLHMRKNVVARTSTALQWDSTRSQEVTSQRRQRRKCMNFSMYKLVYDCGCIYAVLEICIPIDMSANDAKGHKYDVHKKATTTTTNG